MKRRMILIIVAALAVFSGVIMDNPTLAQGDFYVVAGGGGPKGRVLNTQVFTASGFDTIVGTSTWEKLPSPAWNYTKISATSKLVITYQDFLSATVTGSGTSQYQIRANDTYSDGGVNSASVSCSTSTANSYLTIGIWSNLPQGVVTLSIWHRQFNCTECIRSIYGVGYAVVMEIEPN